MISIIGIRHNVQWQEDTEIAREYMEYLRKVTMELGAAVIAEEWSDDAPGADTSNTELVSRDLGVEYLTVDASLQEREEMGLPMPWDIRKRLGLSSGELSDVEKEKLMIEEFKYVPTREKFWFDRLESVRKQEVIFICGEEHLGPYSTVRPEGFEVTLENGGWDVEILPRKFTAKK